MRVLKRVVRLAERGGVVVAPGDPDALRRWSDVGGAGQLGEARRECVTGPPATKTSRSTCPTPEVTRSLLCTSARTSCFPSPSSGSVAQERLRERRWLCG